MPAGCRRLSLLFYPARERAPRPRCRRAVERYFGGTGYHLWGLTVLLAMRA